MNEGKELGPPNWLPLETKLRESGRPVSLCVAFMWMRRERGIDFYRHTAVFAPGFRSRVLAARCPRT